MTPPILDCETQGQTERSLAQLMGISVAQLLDHVREGRIEELPEFPGSPSGETCWFHATRGREDWFRSSGILPLDESVERVWRLVREILPLKITDEDWRRFRRGVEKENYGLQADVFAAWRRSPGPYAFLVGEEPLVRPGGSNHDYLATSELADFIRPYAERQFGLDFCSLLRASTRPLLIKFTVKGVAAGDVAGALSYLSHKERGENVSFATPKYSAKGEPVPPGQILRVIRVRERPKSPGRWEYSFEESV